VLAGVGRIGEQRHKAALAAVREAICFAWLHVRVGGSAPACPVCGPVQSAVLVRRPRPCIACLWPLRAPLTWCTSMWKVEGSRSTMPASASSRLGSSARLAPGAPADSASSSMPPAGMEERDGRAACKRAGKKRMARRIEAGSDRRRPKGSQVSGQLPTPVSEQRIAAVAHPGRAHGW
jgi:hypothetical protein